MQVRYALQNATIAVGEIEAELIGIGIQRQSGQSWPRHSKTRYHDALDAVRTAWEALRGANRDARALSDRLMDIAHGKASARAWVNTLDAQLAIALHAANEVMAQTGDALISLRQQENMLLTATGNGDNDHGDTDSDDG
jgi:hypothetical protein